jgi:hypothetical protein
MKSEHLKNITPEQRLFMQEKARIAREQKKEAAKLLKVLYADEKHWRELASSAGIRLPTAYLPSTETKYLRRAAKKLNIDMQEYLDDCGVKNLRQLVEINPTHTALCEVGLLLEWHFDKKDVK